MLFRQLRLLTLASFAIIVSTACTAELEEGCIGGMCSPPGKPNVPANTTSSSSGGGGAGGSPCETTPATGDFPCDVFTVLQNNCHSCHQSPPTNNAPFSLLTYEDTRVPFGMTKFRWQRIGEVVDSGFMPLGQTMPPADKQILLDWVSTCALPADAMGCE
jgi:hypothetical protein